jgi:hypothetical protein
MQVRSSGIDLPRLSQQVLLNRERNSLGSYRAVGFTAALLLLYCCFTAALLLIYCCFTEALLLLYLCFCCVYVSATAWAAKAYGSSKAAVKQQ